MSDNKMIRFKDALEHSPKLVRRARDLVVYKRAYAASLAVHKATLKFPKEERFALADQLRRSTKSICANLAEGFARQKYSSAEFARFLAIAEGSAAETHVWLDYALDLEYIDKDQHAKWEDDYTAILSMLSKLRPK